VPRKVKGGEGVWLTLWHLGGMWSTSLDLLSSYIHSLSRQTHKVFFMRTLLWLRNSTALRGNLSIFQDVKLSILLRERRGIRGHGRNEI